MVVARPIDYKKQIAEYESSLMAAKGPDVEPFACGVDIIGNRHDDDHRCENSRYGEDFQEYCLIEHRARLTTEVDQLTWLPYMLESFWQNGIDSEGKAFLEKTNFLYKFRYNL
jgi:hypothetical protein